MLRTNVTNLLMACSALAMSLAGPAVVAQTDKPKPQKSSQSQDPKTQRPHKLSEWPKLTRTKKDKVRAIAKQFHKPKEELHAPARRKLIEIGAGAAPILIRMVTDRPESINEHLFHVLDAIVEHEHAALMAREVGRHSVECRRYAMKRLCGFADPDLLPVLQKGNKDPDRDVAFFAALGLLAQKRGDGLDKVLMAAKKRWAEVRALVAEVLPAARSATAGKLVFEKIATARPTEQMAGLRLLRYLMVKDQRIILRTYLQSSDFTVKREAINAARVLHGEPPIEKLSSFQAINMAKQWLGKL